MLKNKAQELQMASSFQLIYPQSISKRYHSSIIKSLIQMASLISPSHLTTPTHTTHTTHLTFIIAITTVLTALNQLGGLQAFIESLFASFLFSLSIALPLGKPIPFIFPQYFRKNSEKY